MVDHVDRRAFVGRAVELAGLREMLSRVSPGGGSTVLVVGEAGIGKTALIERFCTLAGSDGATVLDGGCLDLGDGGPPFAPFAEALRGFVRRVEAARLPALLGPARSELARLLPELVTRADEPVRADQPDASAPGRLFELVLGVLERLGRTGPVLLVVEDLHWSDQGTRDMLAFLVRNLRRSGVLIVASLRTEELHRRPAILSFVAELERDPHVERIELSPFRESEIAEQLGSILGRQAPRDLVERIMDRTAGNPFFSEQLLAAVEEGRSESELPPLLREVLLARVTALTEPAQEVLRAAAAAGRRTDDELLSAVLDLPGRVVAQGLREVVARRILVADGGTDGLGGYAFRHTLLQEVVYAELFSGERVRLHAAFAHALGERGEVGGSPVTAAELAYHWEAAREHARALPFLVEAGRRAEGVYAFVEAGRQYGRALALWARVPGASDVAGVDRAWLLQRAADCAALSGSPARAVDLAREAVSQLSSAAPPDPGRLGMLHERLRWYLWDAGEPQAAAAAVEEAIRLIPVEPPSAARARALAHAAGIRLLAGSMDGAALLASRALETARTSQEDAFAEEALALGVLGWARAVLGEVDEGIALFRQGLEIARRLGGVEGIALGYANLSALLDRVGRTEDALEVAREGFAVAERMGVARTYGGVLLGHAGRALINLGRWEEASAVLDRGLDLDPVGRPGMWLRINRARLDTGLGQYDAAARRLHEARTADEKTGGTDLYRGSILAGTAELAVWRGHLAEVRAAAVEGMRRARADDPPDPALAWLAAVALRAEADAATAARARRDESALAESRAIAGAILERIAAYERRFASGGTSASGRADALASQCRAELARLEGRHDAGLWHEVAIRWESIGRPHPAAYARFRLAEAALSARQDRETAAAALRSAVETARRLGAEPLRRDCELLARQARIDLSTLVEAAPADPDVAASAGASRELGLTEREAEVLRLVAGGWSNQQIGDALFITRKTASVHVSNILGKLGVATRVEAAALAHRLGLAPNVPPPPTGGP